MTTSQRHLPSIERLVSAVAADSPLPRPTIVGLARLLVEKIRQRRGEVPAFDTIVALLRHDVAQLIAPSLRPVINASGVLLQTNLGRAPLSQAARHALHHGAGSVNIEYDLAAGGRGERSVHLAGLLRHLSGAEAAIAVNNNAAAILLTLTGLAAGREVIVSRGQAVEIGGGFRIPDVLRQSGATLVEVGTTNRTYVRDYADAINERTALILQVHTSNFRMQGFVHQAELSELAELAQQRGILLVDNLGSGSFIDVSTYSLAAEPLIPDRIKAGADVVCFSGDKLIGGPQAGIIIGKQTQIARLAKHPLMRAIRLDKLAIAAMQATLQSYVTQTAPIDIPIWQMISQSSATLYQRATTITQTLPAPWQVQACTSTIGGGSLPGETLPSWALVCPHPHPDLLAQQLRHAPIPIIGRIQDGALWLDLRSVAPSDDALITTTLVARSWQ
jgi:L-seryl-tRNA(Ser) seleniumtransferase